MKPAPGMTDIDMTDYDTLLMDYASGVLDETLSLLVATHLTLCGNARRQMALYEALGGALIDECCDPVPMNDDCLQSLLGRLDDGAAETEQAAPFDIGATVPLPLYRHLCRDTSSWKHLRGGISVMNVALSCAERSGALVRANPGASLPRSRPHEGNSYTLVLEGGLRDEARLYNCGDVLILSGGATRQLAADERQGVLYFVIAPDTHTGWLERMLARFGF